MEKLMTFIREKKKIVMGVLCAVVIIAGIGIYMGSKEDNMVAKEIVDSMLKDKDVKEQITDSKEIKSLKDDNVGLLNEKNMYTSKIIFSDKDVAEGEEEYTGGAILVFKNTEDVKFYEQYLALLNTEVESRFSKDEYGEGFVKLMMQDFGVSSTIEGNALLLLDNTLSDKSVRIYKAAFKSTLKDKTYSQEDLPDKKQTESMTKMLKDKAKKEVKKADSAVEKAAQYVITAINDGLTELETSLNEETFETVTQLIEQFNAPYFASNYTNWIERKTGVEIKIAEKKAAEEAERKKQEELKANTHSAGMYKVGTDVAPGEYVVIGSGYLEISKSSSGTLEDIIANENFNNNTIFTVQDGQYLTVKSGTFYPISLSPTVDTSGEGTFKVGVHIPAGEYKIVSTSSVRAYVAVTKNSSHKLDAIISNDNFSGEKYITVKEGQYLTLNRAKLVQ